MTPILINARDGKGKAVEVGDTVTSFRGERYKLLSISPSGGKVYVEPLAGGFRREFFSSVFGLVVREPGGGS